MFNCQKCNNPSQPREAMNRVVIKTRKKVYENKVKRYDEDGFDREEMVTSHGTEIVEEIGVCGKCFNQNNLSAEIDFSLGGFGG